MRIFDLPSKQLFEDLMIDGRKILADIRMKNVAISACKCRVASHRCVSAFAFATGIAIVDQSWLKNGRQNSSQGMMDHAISKGSRTDQARLWLFDGEGFVRARPIVEASQFLLEPNNLSFV